MTGSKRHSGKENQNFLENCNLLGLCCVIITDGHRNKLEVTELTEEKALILLQNGSTEALKWFISKYTPYVSTVIHNIIGGAMSIADVEEVTADVFFALWNNAYKVNSPRVQGYLGSIARNKAKNKMRELGRELPLESDLFVSEDLLLEDKYIESEMQSIVKQEVMSLKEPDREILLRYYYYYQSIAHISEEMGITETNIKVRLHRVRNALKSTLTKYFDE